MEYLQESETQLDSIPLIGKKKDTATAFHIKQFSPYKVTLTVFDVLISMLSFVGCIWISGYLPFMQENPTEFIVLLVFSLLIITFFSTYNLYNFHLIFSKRLHLLNLAKAICWGLAVYMMTFFLYMWPDLFKNNSLFIGFFLFMFFCTMLVLRKYSSDQLLDFIKAMGVSLMAIGTAGLLLSEKMPVIISNPRIIIISLVVAIGVILLNRLLWVHFIFNKFLRRSFRRQIIIIGSDKEAEYITNHIIKHDAPFWITGTVGAKENHNFEVAIPKGCLGQIKDLSEIVKKEKIDEIIVTDEGIDKGTLISILDYCTTHGLTAWFPPKLLKIIDMKLYIDSFCGIPMIRLCSQKNIWVFNKVKHAFDAIITLPIFILQLPIFLFISVLIKLNSKGPVFYQPDAIGKNGRIFKMFKFRSMRIDSDSDVHKKYVSKLIKGEIGTDSESGETLKITDDPRVTSVGKVIRKFSLDELPQLINVLKGDMSLIGPRPCLPYEYEIYDDWHKKRVVVRPGITGLWQVTGRSEVSFEDMILLDLYYIYNRSMIMDLNILYETIFVVMEKKGAY